MGIAACCAALDGTEVKLHVAEGGQADGVGPGCGGGYGRACCACAYGPKHMCAHLRITYATKQYLHTSIDWLLICALERTLVAFPAIHADEAGGC